MSFLGATALLVGFPFDTGASIAECWCYLFNLIYSESSHAVFRICWNVPIYISIHPTDSPRRAFSRPIQGYHVAFGKFLLHFHFEIDLILSRRLR